MVSELSSLRPASTRSTMTNDERYYVRVGKSFKERNTIGTISDLKNFIIKHFNLPHIQVTEGSDGGVVIANLFDGVPDDVEDQNHEVFDNLLKLVGWIEGCIDLPKCLKSVAPKVFDENPKYGMMNDDDRSNKERLEIDFALKYDDELVQIEAKAGSIVTKELSNLFNHQVLEEMSKTIDITETKSIKQEASNQVVAEELL